MENQVDHLQAINFSLVKKISKLFLTISFFLKVSEVLRFQDSTLLFHVNSSMIIRAVYFILLHLTPDQSCRLQKFMVHLILELVSADCVHLALYVYPLQANNLLSIACISLLVFQLKLVSGFAPTCFIIAKFFCCWVWVFLDSEKFNEQVIFLAIMIVAIIINNKLFGALETKNLQLLKQAQRSQVELTILIQSFPTGLSVISRDNQVLIQNRKILQHLECSQEEVVQTMQNFEYLPNRRFQFQDTPDSGVFSDIQESWNLAQGEELDLGLVFHNSKTLEFCVKKITWGDQEALLICVSDAERLIQLEQADTQNRCKNSLLRSISHEMRTPIFAMTSIAETLSDSERLSEEETESLSILKVSSKLLECLVNDLMDYSKIVTGTLKVNLVEFEIQEVLEETFKMIQIQARKKNLRLNLRMDKLLPLTGVSDPLRLQQVLINLLSNALKFTSKGIIELIATCTFSKKLKLSVKDTGIGIPADKLSSIFEMFEGSSNRSLESNGCGLGLNISRLLVKALGGKDLKVKSEFGKGSEFYFSLPISEAVVDAVAESGSQEIIPSEMSNLVEIRNLEIPDNHTYTEPEILVVDDNDFNRMIMACTLRINGFKFLEARNGQEAVDVFKEQLQKGQKLKVILMDCDMPLMNGWEASIEINTLHSDPPKIIACSAFSEPEEIKKSYDSGMVMHLVKPVPNQILLSTLQYFLSI